MVVAMVFFPAVMPHWPGFFTMKGSSPRAIPRSYALVGDAILRQSLVDQGRERSETPGKPPPLAMTIRYAPLARVLHDERVKSKGNSPVIQVVIRGHLGDGSYNWRSFL
jgi:hypothetical protein